jgi:ubiquinone/menaquinone biosynthesis C-methylase UbiE
MTQSFEKEYYESPQFWGEGVLEREGNLERVRMTIDLIPGAVDSLVDVGCGNGLFLNALHDTRSTSRLLGIDRSAEALKYVRTEKQPGDIGSLELRDRSFDCVSCLQVLEHIPVTSYPLALSELARVSGQYLLISVPFAEDLDEGRTTCPSCQAAFNANLHLRSYSLVEFTTLFQPFGFDCIRTVFCGKSTRYRFHKQYRRFFYRSAHKKWFSAVCPVCGYREAGVRSVQPPAEQHRSSLLAALKWLPKQLWPRETKYYWIIGLFQRAERYPTAPIGTQS